MIMRSCNNLIYSLFFCRSAEMLLLCTRAMGIEFFFAAFTAPCTILWDTVRVNRIIRSGEPIFFSIGPVSFGNTFAVLHADICILTAHALVSADNYNTHQFHLTWFSDEANLPLSTVFLAAKHSLITRGNAA